MMTFYNKFISLVTICAFSRVTLTNADEPTPFSTISSSKVSPSARFLNQAMLNIWNSSFSGFQVTSDIEESKFAPYVVYVDATDTKDSTESVGLYGAGTIIGKRMILTSATNLDKHFDMFISKKKEVNLIKRAVIGLSGKAVMSTKTQFAESRTSRCHPAFHPDKIPYGMDIGIMYLKENIKTHEGVIEVAPLPKKPPTVNDTCVVVSWGARDNHGHFKGLQIFETKVSILDWKECKHDLPQVYSEAICILDAKTSMRPCDLTEGSPVFCNDTFVGVVGRWPECMNITKYPVGKPRICASVYHFNDWIASSELVLKADAISSLTNQPLSIVLITTLMSVYVMYRY